MNKIKILLLLFTIVITTNAYPQGNENKKTLHISGSGDISVKPDVANITFNLSAMDIEFGKAVNELNEKVNSLSKALKKVGIPQQEIYSSNYRINKEFKHNYKSGSKTFLGYKVSHTIKVQTLADTKSVNKVFTAIISSVKDAELNLSFAIKDSRKYKDIIIKKAINDAKNKAELIAETAGVELSEIIEIRYSNTPMYFRSSDNILRTSSKMMSKGDDVMIENFNPSKIKQSTTVAIIWKIK